MKKILNIINHILNNKILFLLWSLFLIFSLPLTLEGTKSSYIPSWFISFQVILLPITIICFVIWIFYSVKKNLKNFKIKDIFTFIFILILLSILSCAVFIISINLNDNFFIALLIMFAIYIIMLKSILCYVEDVKYKIFYIYGSHLVLLFLILFTFIIILFNSSGEM